MKIFWVSVVILVTGLSAWATPPTWRHAKEEDQLHGKLVEHFALSGVFLTAPAHSPEDYEPRLIVNCVDGKVDQAYVSTGSVLDSVPVDPGDAFSSPLTMEVRLDGKLRHMGASDVSADGTAAFFSSWDLGKLLRSHEAIIGIAEYVGVQIVIKFDFPDSSEVLKACSRDRLFVRGYR